MVLGLLPSRVPVHESSVGAINENSVGAIRKIQWVRAAPLILRCIRSNVIIITVDRVGELKDLMIDVSWPYVSVLCSTVNRRESDAQTHLLLGSNFLFYFIRYYESVSYFLF